jgi:16S rRNA (guanine966-N2)-methyltransferase
VVMRIIAGSFGGRRLRAHAGAATRPTAERVREALFSILGAPPPGTRVLDLFAGAGTLGLEALSRGAEAAVLIESSKVAARVLRDNVAALGLGDRATVVCDDAIRALGRLPAGARFRWVFLDPPYRTDLAARALAVLDAEAGSDRLLERDAVVVVEHDRRNPCDLPRECLVRTDRRRYGDTEVSFYRRGGTG